jgi:hypothetical protein
MFYILLGIHCFLRQEVCGDLFILVKGRCVAECPANHLFVEPPAVMGASFIWYLFRVCAAKCAVRLKYRSQEHMQAIVSSAYAK